MNTAFKKIAYFNTLIGNDSNASLKQIAAQVSLIKEEFDELVDAVNAFASGNADSAIVEIRDAIADVLVTTYGLAHRMGIDADADLETVFNSNMSKFIKGTFEDALSAAEEVAGRLGLNVTTVETAPGIWAITNKTDAKGLDGKFYPVGKLLKPSSFKAPNFYAPSYYELNQIPVVPTTTIDISEPVELSKLQDFLKGNPSMVARWEIVKQVTIAVPGSFEVFIKGDTSETIREQRNILEELVLGLLGASSVEEANNTLGDSFKRSSIRTYMEADWDSWKLRVFEYEVPALDESSWDLEKFLNSEKVDPMAIVKMAGNIFYGLSQHYLGTQVIADGFRTMYAKAMNTRTSDIRQLIPDICKGFELMCQVVPGYSNTAECFTKMIIEGGVNEN